VINALYFNPDELEDQLKRVLHLQGAEQWKEMRRISFRYGVDIRIHRSKSHEVIRLWRGDKLLASVVYAMDTQEDAP